MQESCTKYDENIGIWHIWMNFIYRFYYWIYNEKKWICFCVYDLNATIKCYFHAKINDVNVKFWILLARHASHIVALWISINETLFEVITSFVPLCVDEMLELNKSKTHHENTCILICLMYQIAKQLIQLQ